MELQHKDIERINRLNTEHRILAKEAIASSDNIEAYIHVMALVSCCYGYRIYIPQEAMETYNKHWSSIFKSCNM